MNWIEYNKSFDEFVKEGLFKCGTIIEYMDMDNIFDETYNLSPLAKIFCKEHHIPEECFYPSELWRKWRYEKVFKEIGGEKPDGFFALPKYHDEYEEKIRKIERDFRYLNNSQIPIKRKYLIGSRDSICDEHFYFDTGLTENTKILRYKKLDLDNEFGDED